MGGDALRAALPAHRAIVANALARMNGDMRQVNMPADQAWTAPVDSIRRDLICLPDLERHQEMMKSMRP